MLRTISLFSGCGGKDFGAKRAGAKIIFANDNDANACETLRQSFPGTKVIEADIADVLDFPEADLVIGGYPCQSFSMGGNRNPSKDKRTHLYEHFARCLDIAKPKFFVAENVDGLQKIQNGSFLSQQTSLFETMGGAGYNISIKRLDARDYGVPQKRKRIFIVGIRKDLNCFYEFPLPTHTKTPHLHPDRLPYTSHGDVIADLPPWPTGEFYERPHDPEGHFSWYYMSRNRKAKWDAPSYTIVANWRHTTLHPGGPTMELEWSDLKNGWKQKWRFTGHFEHLEKDASRPRLTEPRRLSWRECARIQTFPRDFEPFGSTESKFTQIGNAVPPDLAEAVIKGIVTGNSIKELRKGQQTHQIEMALVA
jgi:DNA (cytosine-5)-methyltransferase 1